MANQQCFSKHTFVKTKKNALWLDFHPVSPTFLCEQQQEEERWTEADTYTASTQYWLRDVTYHNLTHSKNDNA